MRVAGILGEIRVFSGIEIPEGWKACDGSLLDIGDYQALFSLFGNQFGGDGRRTFALPDLRGRTPLGGKGSVGARGGTESEALTVAQLPPHSHPFQATTNLGTGTSARDSFFASVAPGPAGADLKLYGPPAQLQSLDPACVLAAGGNEPHSNMQPFIAVNFCICVRGIFPRGG